jgi:hypothetical protein
MGILGIISWLWLVILAITKGISLNRKYMAERFTYNPQEAAARTHPNSSQFANRMHMLRYPDYLFPGLISAVVVFLIHNIIDFSFFLPEFSRKRNILLMQIPCKTKDINYRVLLLF